MKSFRIALIAAIIPGLAMAETAPVLMRADNLKQELKGMIDRQEFAGINAVVCQQGKVVFTASVGDQDREAKIPMKPDSIFWVASLSKPVTAVAVMMLYEEGKFQLGDPVAKYLPAFAQMQVLKTENGSQTEVEEAARPMTVAQLLTHTSGLFNNQGYNAAHISFRPAQAVSLQETVRKLAAVPLSHQPGQAWRYGVSYDVLSALIEVWSGQPLDVFLQRRIFAPLGMTDTAFYVPSEKRDRLAKRYQLNETKVLVLLPEQRTPSERPVFCSGAAGLYSTTGDYLAFCQMLLNGGKWNAQQLLKPETIALMWRNHVLPPVMPADGPNGRVGYGQGWGFYVMVDPAAMKSVCPEGEVNAAGVAATFLWIDRKNDLIGLFFAQRPPQTQTTLNQFKQWVYHSLPLSTP